MKSHRLLIALVACLTLAARAVSAQPSSQPPRTDPYGTPPALNGQYNGPGAGNFGPNVAGPRTPEPQLAPAEQQREQNFANPQELPPAEAPAKPEKLFLDSQKIAEVGDQHILYGEVNPAVNQILGPALAKAKTQLERDQIESYREKLIQQFLKQLIDSKIFYVEFKREMRAKAKDKLAEAERQIQGKIRASFDESLQKARKTVEGMKKSELDEYLRKDPVIPRLAVLMRDNEIETQAELDRVLRETGSSLEKQIKQYGEFNLGRSLFPQRVNFKPEVSHMEMVDYFRANPAKFAVQAKARWEILSVKFANFPNKDEAWKALANMGNEVYFGAPFASVAKKFSQEGAAERGGYHDWTTQGSLASDEIDNAIFTLEIGKLSKPITDAKGYHIVRVIERKSAGYVPFEEAQTEIKETISTEKKEKAYRKFVDELRKKTRVWTIFDKEEEAAEEVATQPTDNQRR